MRALVVFRFSLGQLLAGRRLVLLTLAVALPLLLPALLADVAGEAQEQLSLDLFRNLVLPLVLPVVSLAFSTSALGSEVRDGTIVNLVLKPLRRPSVLLAKYLAALTATLLLVVTGQVAAHLVALRGLGAGDVLAATVAATAVGAAAYCALGVLLSLLLNRALLVGLIYVLVQSGLVAAAPSTASLSVSSYADGVLAGVLEGLGRFTIQAQDPALSTLAASILAAAVTVAALVLATRRLATMDFS